jgi:hypothetical protein
VVDVRGRCLDDEDVRVREAEEPQFLASLGLARDRRADRRHLRVLGQERRGGDLPAGVRVDLGEQQITEANADQIRARLVVEGANGPSTPEADAILAARDVMVVPDILANAGGVVVSYFEWVQDLQALFWTEEQINERLQRLMIRAFSEVVATAETRGTDLRTAALVRAIERVAEAIMILGIYP